MSASPVNGLTVKKISKATPVKRPPGGIVFKATVIGENITYFYTTNSMPFKL